MTMHMKNSTYDFLKWIAMIVLPATSTLYLALAGLWGLPYPEAISGTIMALDTFLGSVLGIASKDYTGEEVKDYDDL